MANTDSTQDIIKQVLENKNVATIKAQNEMRELARRLQVKNSFLHTEDRICSDLTNLCFPHKIRTSNEQDSQWCNKMIFTPSNIRALRKASYIRFAMGCSLLTYNITQNIRTGAPEIDLEFYTPLDFIPRFDSFGKITDVATIHDMIITDPQEVAFLEQQGINKWNGEMRLVVLKYLSGGDNLIFTCGEEGRWGVTNRLGDTAILSQYPVLNKILSVSPSSYKWEILTTQIVDPDKFYSPYSKSMFNKTFIIDELENIAKHFHNTLENSEPIIFVDQITFYHLKRQLSTLGSDAAKIQTELELKYGKDTIAKISGDGKLSGIYKMSSLSGDDPIRQVNIDIRAAEYTQSLEWFQKQLCMQSGIMGLYDVNAGNNPAGGNTFMNNQASMNRQLKATIDNIIFEDNAVLDSIYTDALMNCGNQTLIDPSINDLVIEREDPFTARSERLQTGMQLVSGGIISKYEFLTDPKYYGISSERAMQIMVEVMIEQMTPMAPIIEGQTQGNPAATFEEMIQGQAGQAGATSSKK